MLTIGLTGGIGSGKSAVAKILAELGAVVINADEVAHRLYCPGQPAYHQLLEAFGPGILAADGTIDRAKLGAIVFADPQALQRLNRLLHPLIRREIQRRIDELRGQGEKRPIVVEAAVLIEAGWHDLCQQVWLVTASQEEVLKRLGQSRGLTEEQVKARIRAQLSDQERRKFATVVIENDEGIEQLRAKVRSLWESVNAGG